MNSKEEFCRTFKWEIDIAWFDLTGYAPIDNERRAKITLSIRGPGRIPTQCHYVGFSVKILNKNDGVIDSKFFRWSDYLVIPSEKMPLNGIQVISYVKWDWHQEAPEDTRPISAAIEKYIEIFR